MTRPLTRIRLLGGAGLLALALAGCGAETGSWAPAAQATVAPTSAPTAAPATAAPTAATAPTATHDMSSMATATHDMSSMATATHDMSDMGGSGAKAEATIQTFQFKPEPLEVKAGTTVTWTNNDDIEHSVTAGAPPSASGAFDSGFFTKGQTWSHTFDEPGEFAYFCMRHNSMVGTVKVTE